MNKKVILQINTVINSGSTGRIAAGIGDMATQNGWKSYIAFGRNEQPCKSNKIKIGNNIDINLHGLKTRFFDQHGFGSRKATEKLIEEIKRIQPDIIHLHNLHGYYLNIEVLFNYLSTIDTSIVWTLHDCWPITGHCSYFSYANCEKWKTHCSNCPQKKEYPASFVMDNSYRNFEKKRELFTSVKNLTLVPVSHWLENLLRKSFLHTYPIQVIHNGINLDVFEPKNTSKIKEKYNLFDKFVMLGVANIWEKRKGLDDFIKLNELLKNDEILILVGLTHKQIKSLPKNIIGIQRTENVNELAELYSIADVVLNLSYEETFGMTTVEGFACGTPGIVYNATASPELVDKSTGLVVESGDINGLVNAIQLIKRKGKQSYVDACLDRVYRLYKKEDRFEEYILLYEKLLNKN